MMDRMRNQVAQGRAVHSASHIRAVLVFTTVTLLLSGYSSSTSAPGHTSTSMPSASATPQTREQQLDDLWKYYTASYPDAIRPDVTFIRYVQQNEWATIQADCMNAMGFLNVSETPDGGLASGTVPEAQAEAYQVASYVCDAEYPLDPKYSIPLTDDRIGVLYDYYVDELTPCLEKEGYSVTPAPSESTFISSYRSGGWTPYADINTSFAGTQEEWYRINKVCPQWPADFYE